MFQDVAALPLGGVPAPRASPRCPPRPAGTWQGHCLGKPARASAPGHGMCAAAKLAAIALLAAPHSG